MKVKCRQLLKNRDSFNVVLQKNPQDKLDRYENKRINIGKNNYGKISTENYKKKKKNNELLKL